MTATSRKRGTRLALLAVVALACVALDQWAKAAALAGLVPGRPRTLVPGVMDLLLVRNTGAAFSLGEGAGWVFVLIALAVVAAVAVYVWRSDTMPTYLVVTLGLVAGGGIGNLIDRVSRGWVCDFLATSFVDFPVFNVADIFVCCGVAATVVAMYLWERSLEQDKARRDAGAARAGTSQDAASRLRDGGGRR